MSDRWRSAGYRGDDTHTNDANETKETALEQAAID